MSIGIVKSKNQAASRPPLNRQVAQAKAILRQLRDTLEDLEDRRDLARARKKNAGKPGTDWAAAKKELGFNF